MNPPLSATESEDCVLSWIHLSDIHVGEGNAEDDWDQRGMLRELLRDVKDRPEGAPRPDVIFVTGDVAFSGNTRIRPGNDRSWEYARATDWLLEVAQAVNLGPDKIFVIPGNHDIQRTYPPERQAMRLLRSLRQGQPDESLDDALRDAGDRRLLTARLRSYLMFARQFAPMCLAPATQAEQWLYWSCPLEMPGRHPIRLIGLNSALLCNDESDAGCLVLNRQQIDLLASDEKTPRQLRIVLSHHPFNTQWVRNSAAVRKALTGRAHIVLSGHEHDPKLQEVREPSRKGFIEVFAGAIYASSRKEPVAYTYNYGSVHRSASGEAELHIWPRRWSEEWQTYRTHADLVEEGARHTTWELAQPLKGVEYSRHERLEPSLGPLAGIQVLNEPSWLVGEQQARAWLTDLDLADNPAHLIRGCLSVENNGASEAIDPLQEAGDPWRVGAIERLVRHARRPGAVSPVFIHGLRGVGITTLLLRYVAAQSAQDGVRVLIDCASNCDRSVKTGKEALRTRLQRLPVNTQSLFLAIDGLDLSWRTQTVRDGDPDASVLFASEIRDFLRIVKDETRLAGATAVVVFTSSDPPSLQPGQDLVAEKGWAAPEFSRVMQELGGLSVRMDPGVASVDGDVWSQILPFSLDDLSHVGQGTNSFLQLPVYFDALRHTDPGTLKVLQTRRDFLREGSKRASPLGTRRHSYYKVLSELTDFIDSLGNLWNDPGAFQASVRLLEKEITGEWIYLLPLSTSESAVQKRMVELRDWLVRDRWRYSESYALSNLVSALAHIGERNPTGSQKYIHCNLRNVNMHDRSISDAEFHGVDLSGAQVSGGRIADTKFYGVDFSRAQFTGTTLENAKFVGCLFDDGTFDADVRARSVQVIEPLPEGWGPKWSA